MKHPGCNRAWQAEAREDGRLEAADLASFERHLLTCEACTKEVQALRDLAAKMGALPEPSRTELERRRARSELLRNANQKLTAKETGAKRWRAPAVVGVLALAVAAILWVQVYHGDAQHPPTFEVKDVGQAVWSVETSDATSRVTLRAGTAAFQVDRVQSGARFLVELPDGSIEVKGTRFVVDVEKGQTQRVEVFEGTVLLRLPAFEGLLHAGERFPRETLGKASAPLAPSASATANLPDEHERAMPAEEEKPAAIAPSASFTPAARASASAVLLPTASASAASSSPSPSPKDAAGPRFAEAMGAFSAGDYGRADGLLAAFIQDFPRDGRAEDAMFLRAQARARRGDRAGAAAVAREYLRAFPRGLRRPEAERLAGEK